MTAPPVSLLMTVRDGERYLEAALRSALEQTVPPHEIVVVDDGSSDRTPDILRDFGGALTVLHQPPTGMAAGLNRALRQARHEVVAFLDADDFYTPDAMETRLARLEADDAPDAVGGWMVQFASPEMDAAAIRRLRFDPGPVKGALLGAVILRRAWFTRVGPLNEDFQLAPTIDWMARARSRGLRMAWTDSVVLHRRIHTTNLTQRRRAEEHQALLSVVRGHHHRAQQSKGAAPG
ncbi:MAG TPA: glycosyltransferase family A protein [Acidimicrobiales bacterium]|jgi:glycosyltransferase involved in cell wall biosynthesis|nr:glycosyltransferase family A protein [Acidimicrobiales bacterium]